MIFNKTPDSQYYYYQEMSDLFILLSYTKRQQIIEIGIIEIGTIVITGLLAKKEKKGDDIDQRDWYHLSSFT